MGETQVRLDDLSGLFQDSVTEQGDIRTSEAGYLQEGARAISVALPSERSGLCSVVAAGGGCWEQRKGPA